MSRPPSPAAETAARSNRSVDDPVYIRLIQMMTASRRAAIIRQVDLATKLGQPQSYISKVESRERRIDVGEFVAWMRALGADPVAMLAQVLADGPGQGTPSE